MVGRIGRQVNFFFGGNSPGDEIEGVREKGLSCNGEPIDVTSDENSGVRTLLTNLSAQDEININVSGVTKDTRLKQAWFNNQRTQPITLVYPDGSMLSGQFYMNSYEESDSYQEAGTFTASLMSDGVITYTP